MSTPLVLALTAVAVGAGVVGTARIVDPPSPPVAASEIVLLWAVRGLLTAALVVFTLRGYFLIDAVIATEGEGSSTSPYGWGGSVGDAVAYGVPDVLVQPGILAALGCLLLALRGRGEPRPER